MLGDPPLTYMDTMKELQLRQGWTRGCDETYITDLGQQKKRNR